MERKPYDAPRDPSLVEQDERMAAQTEYDPKLHGAGTMPVQEPDSVKEMWGHVKSLMVRVEMLEQAAKKKVSAFGKSE